MQATTSRKTFRMECSISADIRATPETIWQILTNAKDYTRWNTTIISFEGSIRQGAQIKLKSTLDPKRTFKLKVSKQDAPHTMVWEDGMAPMFKGVRTYRLTKLNKSTTRFTMTEVFSGIMLPLIAGSLPDFKPNFEQFATDLKKTAEQ